MKANLVRTGSFTAQSPALPGSPRVSLSRHGSLSAGGGASPRVSLQLESRRGGGQIRRALSESDVMRLEFGFSGDPARLSGSRSFAAMILEEEEEEEEEEELGGWPGTGISLEELGISGGGGFGKEKKSGGGNSKGKSGEDMSKMREYYEMMIKSNPGDSLLLRNYGHFLHEVEGDVDRAEKCYGKAILASPGDGEVLSLYGKLIWDSHRDEERAKSYFDQAVLASPDDCSVLGSYAHFMWEAEEEDDEAEAEAEDKALPLVAAT